VIHKYPGHQTRVAAGGGNTFTTSYKLRPLSQGTLAGIDHFFGFDAAQPIAAVSVTVTYSDTFAFDVLPGTLALYRLDDGSWVTDGITTVGRKTGELTAVITRPGSFAVLGERPALRAHLPMVLKFGPAPP
jgi:hypothetical protein